ncbi:glutamate receptor U1 precursor, putative [Pediculus humanus corporis]|uniref:Glutamate receptor U1, putative n=1 Tax=Pediculus humanus subsp. corporis TaxID=121224 RepID=E0VB96_PEDHC|nr:glutamate receptor U1 precursor, putative [Pediculus humanus corporis]EEB10652.1 glutamate receptor U1 precursor, putative [Pediculus humanus corporis]
MAVAFLPIMHALQSSITYSKPLTEFEWVLLMSRPTASANKSGLLAPFKGEVWILILISLIIAGPTMYYITYLTKKFSNRLLTTRNQYTLNSCAWFVYGALMKQGSTLNPEYDAPRLFFATWWIFITILTSFYTANLTAFLTLSHFKLTIETTKDIYDHKQNSFDYLKESFPQYGRLTTDSLPVRLENILKGKIYVTEKRKADKILLLNYLNKTREFLPENQRCAYVSTPKSILFKSMGFGYQKNSKIKSVLDPLINEFINGGIIDHLLQANLPLSKICPLEIGGRERKLLNSDLLTTYIAIFIGFGTAIIAFCGEKYYGSKPNNEGLNQNKNLFNNKIRDVLFENDKTAVLNENNFYYEYYKELIPFNYQRNGNFVIGGDNFGFMVPEKKPQRILYQFIH